jgi:hypothetical protein
MARLISYVWRRLIAKPDPPLPSRIDKGITPEPLQAHP